MLKHRKLIINQKLRTIIIEWQDRVLCWRNWIQNEFSYIEIRQRI